METVVRLEGIQEQILEKLVGDGYYKTKSEAIRAGLLGLGKEYKVIQKIEDELALKKMLEMEKSKKKYSLKEVAKKYGFE